MVTIDHHIMGRLNFKYNHLLRESTLMNHQIDHALTAISCPLDGMETVLQMMMEVDSAYKVAIGYLMNSCVSNIRKRYAVIEVGTNVDSAGTDI